MTSARLRVITTIKKRWVSWICGRALSQGKSSCIGSRISEPRLIALTKENPITEPVIFEEVRQDENRKRTRQKDYRFIPVSANPASEPRRRKLRVPDTPALSGRLNKLDLYVLNRCLNRPQNERKHLRLILRSL